MTVKEALAVVDVALALKGLTRLQALVFRYTQEGLNYTEIAKNYSYKTKHVKKVRLKLWQHFSKVFGEKVTKTNIQSVLRRQTQYRVTRVELLDKIAHKRATGNYYQNQRKVVNIAAFYRRTQELATLEQWIVGDRYLLIVLLGMGRIGTVIVKAQQVQEQFEYVIERWGTRGFLRGQRLKPSFALALRKKAEL